MNRLATHKTVVVIPLVVEVVPVPDPATGIVVPVDVVDVARGVGVTPMYAMRHLHHHPSIFSGLNRIWRSDLTSTSHQVYSFGGLRQHSIPSRSLIYSGVSQRPDFNRSKPWPRALQVYRPK